MRRVGCRIPAIFNAEPEAFCEAARIGNFFSCTKTTAFLPAEYSIKLPVALPMELSVRIFRVPRSK